LPCWGTAAGEEIEYGWRNSVNAQNHRQCGRSLHTPPEQIAARRDAWIQPTDSGVMASCLPHTISMGIFSAENFSSRLSTPAIIEASARCTTHA